MTGWLLACSAMSVTTSHAGRHCTLDSCTDSGLAKARRGVELVVAYCVWHGAEGLQYTETSILSANPSEVLLVLPLHCPSIVTKDQRSGTEQYLAPGE